VATHQLILKPLALAGLLAGLLACASATHAAITVYTTPASFAAATSAVATDTFNGEPLGGPNFPHVGTAGPYGYSADATFDGIYFVGSVADVWLSTTSPAETVTFYDLTGGASALGGNFFATDFDGAVLPGLQMTLSASNGPDTVTHTLFNSSAASFVGFVSDQPLLRMTVDAATPTSGDSFATVNDLRLGLVASAVPEPATWALMLAGVGLVGTRLRRSV
jgi:hypothetical protein